MILWKNTLSILFEVVCVIKITAGKYLLYMFDFENKIHGEIVDRIKPRRPFGSLQVGVLNKSETDLSEFYFDRYNTEILLWVGEDFEDFISEFPEYFI